MKTTLYLFIFVAGLTRISYGQPTTYTKGFYVNDYAYVLTGEQRICLREEIKELSDSIGSQIVILIIPTLNGQKLNDYSLKIANEWGVGRKDYDDGILITIVINDRVMRIEVGLGLEKIITDEIAASINMDMKPEFKEEKYYEGLNIAVTRIKNLIKENKELIGQR